MEKAKLITSMDVAKFLGVESDYKQELKREQMVERYNKLVNKK